MATSHFRWIFGDEQLKEGFVYSAHELSPITDDTLKHYERGYFYKPLEDGWYLYVAR